jgi:hypothetical protein
VQLDHTVSKYMLVLNKLTFFSPKWLDHLTSLLSCFSVFLPV